MHLLKQSLIHKIIVLGLSFGLSLSVFAEDLDGCIDSPDICLDSAEIIYGDYNLETTQTLAMQGDVKAQRDLGYNYKYGFTVDKDSVKAFEWLEKAAYQGDADAQYGLAFIYFSGDGVSKDINKAMQWLLKSAHQGYASAQSYLAKIYFTGRADRAGLEDYTKAAEWATKAALQEDESSQRLLAMLYKHGFGVRQNTSIAREWYGKSCDNGSEYSCKEYKRLSN